MQSNLSFGNYTLLARISQGERVMAPPFACELERQGFAERQRLVLGRMTSKEEFLAITDVGALHLSIATCPPFPALGRIDDHGICPRCDHPYPISLCVGEAQ